MLGAVVGRDSHYADRWCRFSCVAAFWCHIFVFEFSMLSILGGDHVRGWFSGARIWRVVAGID